MVPGAGFVLFQLALSQTMPGHGPGTAWAKEHHHRQFRCSPPVLEGKALITRTQTGLCQLASGPENSPMHVLFTRIDELKCFQECSLRCWIGSMDGIIALERKKSRIKVVIGFSKYLLVLSYGSAVHSFISRNPKRDQISYCPFLLLLLSCTVIIHL